MDLGARHRLFCGARAGAAGERPRRAVAGLLAAAAVTAAGCAPQPAAGPAAPPPGPVAAPPPGPAAAPPPGPAAGLPSGPAAAAPPVGASFGEPARFALDKAALRAQGASAGMIEKLDASAYRYFRMLGPQFAARACWGVRDVRWYLPVVAVHGDAHVEQFVVTRATYGLEDFDQSGYGPAVVDLVRYAASLHVACHDAPWPCRPDDAVAAFFRAYRDALARPPGRAGAPKVVERLRSKSAQGRGAWLRWADALMLPLDPAEDAAYRARWGEFVRLANDVRPGRSPHFFDIGRAGALQMGVGSALEKKLLFRVRGESDAPDDDLVLEARSFREPNGGECVWRPAHGGSLHVLLFMSVLGRRMPDVVGFVELDEHPGSPEYWVQSWDAGYRELSLSDLESQAELEEVATDAARQLAGHFWTQFPEALLGHQRFAQVRAFDLLEARARGLSRDLAAEAVAEWERFRRAP